MPASTTENAIKIEKARLPLINARWQVLLMWTAVVALLLAAIAMRLYRLDVPFDRDSYDEGVYWQSLRAMSSGHALYSDIFYSQPPFFLLSTFPAYMLFGSTLWSARLGIALVSLFGLVGACLLGKALSGRLGAVAALLLIVVSPQYLAASQTIQAEASSTAFSLLAVGLAYLWWEHPEGVSGLCWAALTGITLALGILCKLFSLSCLVPIGLLLLARLWQIWHQQRGISFSSLRPMLLGILACLVTALLVLLPFAGSYSNMISDVLTFHSRAAAVFASSQKGNISTLEHALTSSLGLAALVGTIAALIRRDWRVLPLLAWLLATLYLLWHQVPLFQHHLVALVPPLIGLAVIGLSNTGIDNKVPAKDATMAELTRLMNTLAKYAPWIAVILILVTVGFAAQHDKQYYSANASIAAGRPTQKALQVAADLQHAIRPNQLVITDAQFIAALADRNTLPSLVDTSSVRIISGYLTVGQLESAASQPQVHAVLFYTGRLNAASKGAFHTWVAQHFRLLYRYGSGQELWVR